jgi:hypothetical protein
MQPPDLGPAAARPPLFLYSAPFGRSSISVAFFFFSSPGRIHSSQLEARRTRRES